MNTFSYKGRTLLDVSLRLLDLAIDDEMYLAVLGPLAKGIGIAKSRVDEISDLDFKQFGEPLIDLETDLIENLLGATYVVCQAKITAVAQAAVNVRKAALAENLTVNAFGDQRSGVHRLGPNFDTTYSKIEILWSLGNYFKHRDEWPIGT